MTLDDSGKQVVETIKKIIMSYMEELLAFQGDETVFSQRVRAFINFLENCIAARGEAPCLAAMKAAMRHFDASTLRQFRKMLEQFQDESRMIKKRILPLLDGKLTKKKKRKMKKASREKIFSIATFSTSLYSLESEDEFPPETVEDEVEDVLLDAPLRSGREFPVESVEASLETETSEIMEGAPPPPPPPTNKKRNVVIDYFSQMNVLRVYPLMITISKEKIKVRKYRGDILTGEKREQTEKEITLREESPLTVEVYFPGCLVTPTEQRVALSDHPQELTFFVTPLAKGKMDGRIVFYQDGQELATFKIKFKVIDQRLAKLFALSAMVISAVPSSLYYLFGIDVNQLLTSRLSHFIPVLTSPVLLVGEVMITLVLLGLSYYLFKKYSAIRKQLLGACSPK